MRKQGQIQLTILSTTGMPQLRRNTNVVWPPHPPPDETASERNIRLDIEKEAKRVSDTIDHILVIDKEQKQKKERSAKILLLGQAESGKSTVLKNFQLQFSPNAFQAQAEAWRPIIQLNLVRSVNFILDLLGASNPSPHGSVSLGTSSPTLEDDLRHICMKLIPLRAVEETLTNQVDGPTPQPLDGSEPLRYNPAKISEVSMRSGSRWRVFTKFRCLSESEATASETLEDSQTRRIINACADDIAKLWANQAVQACLNDQGILLQTQPGFFLSEVSRIASEDYKPTADDILRARVHTIGPEEHRITMETAKENGDEWTIYDVGGSRTQRPAWAQFFDDVNVIIFLAPISAFDQKLSEDETVNRLSDSFSLWQCISSNKLLAPVELILFLNKLDILDSKLKSGILFSKYVSSYKHGPNETKPVAKYLRDKFSSVHQQHTPRQRKVHSHLTCAIDTKATAKVLTQIREVILLRSLTKINLL